MHFSKNTKPGSLSIKIVNTTLKSSEKAKFPGVIFDHKINFNARVNYTLEKCNRALYIIKFTRGTWWGADPSTLLLFYKSFIRSILDYASHVYYPPKKNIQNKIEKLQFKSIRLALGYRISTPTETFY